MSDGIDGAPAALSGTPSSGPSLRVLGALTLLMFVLTSAVGGSLSLESSYPVVPLAGHIGLALVTLGVSGYARVVARRSYETRPQVAAVAAAAGAGGATLSGIVFLLFGHSDAALFAMVGFALLGIVASLAVIALGGPSGRRAVGTTA